MVLAIIENSRVRFLCCCWVHGYATSHSFVLMNRLKLWMDTATCTSSMAGSQSIVVSSKCSLQDHPHVMHYCSTTHMISAAMARVALPGMSSLPIRNVRWVLKQQQPECHMQGMPLDKLSAKFLACLRLGGHALTRRHLGCAGCPCC